MNRKIYLFCLGMITACLLNTSYAKEPKNLALIKGTLIQYHDSGEYEKDQARVIDHALQYLKIRLHGDKHKTPAKKLAVVLDIDETSLSNYPDMLKMSFGGTLPEIMAAEDNGMDPAIKPTLELYQYAKAHNVSVFFITGRTETSRTGTEKNLQGAGYKSWDGLSFKEDDYRERSAAPYKIRARSLIEKQGYDIVLNIGDQQSDLVGGHADKTFKLPNPYYFIP